MSEKADSGNQRVCAGSKKQPVCSRGGKREMQLERHVEVPVWTVRSSRMKSLDLLQEAKRNRPQRILKQEGKLIETEDASGTWIQDRLEWGVISFSRQEGVGPTA